MPDTDDEEAAKATPARALPPIHRVKEPYMQHASTRIRWYQALGYTPLEIHKGLGIRYQQVRNVLNTEPKRATREDLPSLEIETWELDDDADAMASHALDVEMAAQRLEDLKKRASANRAAIRARKKGGEPGSVPDDEDEVDEINEPGRPRE